MFVVVNISLFPKQENPGSVLNTNIETMAFERTAICIRLIKLAQNETFGCEEAVQADVVECLVSIRCPGSVTNLGDGV